MGDDSITRLDASFADDTQWVSSQWIDGQPMEIATISADGYAAAQSEEADDAEAEQLSAVLLAVGAVLTTVRSGNAQVNQPSAEPQAGTLSGNGRLSFARPDQRGWDRDSAPKQPQAPASDR